MRDAVPQSRRSSFYQIANELIELYQQQMDALQRDPSEAEHEEYLERRRQINELRMELGMERPHSRPS
jgi:hypothetical protein